MAKLPSLTIFAIVAFVFADITQIQAEDKEKAKALLESIERLVETLATDIGYGILGVDSHEEYIPIYRVYQAWKKSSLRLVRVMIQENDECTLAKPEALEKIQNILSSLDQAKTEADKVAEGLQVPDHLQQAIDLKVANTKKYINDDAEDLYAQLPDAVTGFCINFLDSQS